MKEAYIDVIGYIPGHDALGGLDSHVIIVSAYYDGLGVGPDGVLYPGANDNASGVAAMLEIARAMQETIQPRKTVVFVAWSGGERGEGFSVKNAMGAKLGFNLLTVDAVIELSGMAAGSGKGLALGPGTSFSLVQLFQDAGAELGTAVTTRGRGPHFGMETAPGFGGRSALSAYVSWDGSDQDAHTRLRLDRGHRPREAEAVGSNDAARGQRAQPVDAVVWRPVPISHHPPCHRDGTACTAPQNSGCPFPGVSLSVLPDCGTPNRSNRASQTDGRSSSSCSHPCDPSGRCDPRWAASSWCRCVALAALALQVVGRPLRRVTAHAIRRTRRLRGRSWLAPMSCPRCDRPSIAQWSDWRAGAPHGSSRSRSRPRPGG